MKFDLTQTTPPSAEPEEFDLIKKGNYPGIVEEMKIREVDRRITPWKDNNWDVTFRVKIKTDDGSERMVFADVAVDGDPRDTERLRSYLGAIQGVHLPSNFELDSETLHLYQGKSVLVNINHYWSKKFSEVRHKIGDLLPLNAGTATPSVAQPTPAPEPIANAYQYGGDEPF